MCLMKRDTHEPLLLPSFPLSFSLKKDSSPLHIFLFLTKINPPLSGQIFDETQIHLVPPSFDHLPRRSQSKPNYLLHHHSNLYLFPSLFFPYLSLVFRPLHPLYLFTFSISLFISSITKMSKNAKNCLV